MIANEKQLELTKYWLCRWEKLLKEGLKNERSDFAHDIHIKSIKSMVEDLSEQIEEYLERNK
jgi:hypothetical protein